MADSGACRSCIFCQQASDIEHLTQEEDMLTHGVVHTHDGITTHYFCLLLASLMEQNGKDSEGILGFLPKDILALVDKSKHNVCTYCKQPGATIYCVSRNCKSIFHLPCGTKRGSTHHFFETFRSFCPAHRPKPILKPVFEIEPDRDENGHVVCIICFDSILTYENKNIVKAPCCGYRSWFHKLCIQKLAVSFGYFFKCPLCNDIDKFYKAMLHYGIFIPEQDASWELAPNAFMELLERPDECSKEHCLCPKGKKHNVDGTRWELLLCNLCGHKARHKRCLDRTGSNDVYECKDCTTPSLEPAPSSSIGSQPNSSRGHEECWPPHRKPKKKLGWKNGYIPLSKKKNKSTSFIKQDQDGKPLVSERLLDPSNEAGVATQVVGDHHLEYDSLYVMDVYHIHNEDSMKEGTSPNNITIELCTVPYHVVSQFVQLVCNYKGASRGDQPEADLHSETSSNLTDRSLIPELQSSLSPSSFDTKLIPTPIPLEDVSFTVHSQGHIDTIFQFGDDRLIARIEKSPERRSCYRRPKVQKNPCVGASLPTQRKGGWPLGVKRKHPELNCSKSVSSSSSHLKNKSNCKRSKFSNNNVKDTDIFWSEGSVEDSDYSSLDMEPAQNNPVEQSRVTSTPQESLNTILAACANTLEGNIKTNYLKESEEVSKTSYNCLDSLDKSLLNSSKCGKNLSLNIVTNSIIYNIQACPSTTKKNDENYCPEVLKGFVNISQGNKTYSLDKSFISHKQMPQSTNCDVNKLPTPLETSSVQMSQHSAINYPPKALEHSSPRDINSNTTLNYLTTHSKNVEQLSQTNVHDNNILHHFSTPSKSLEQLFHSDFANKIILNSHSAYSKDLEQFPQNNVSDNLLNIPPSSSKCVIAWSQNNIPPTSSKGSELSSQNIVPDRFLNASSTSSKDLEQLCLNNAKKNIILNSLLTTAKCLKQLCHDIVSNNIINDPSTYLKQWSHINNHNKLSAANTLSSSLENCDETFEDVITNERNVFNGFLLPLRSSDHKFLNNKPDCISSPKKDYSVNSNEETSKESSCEPNFKECDSTHNQAEISEDSYSCTSLIVDDNLNLDSQNMVTRSMSYRIPRSPHRDNVFRHYRSQSHGTFFPSSKSCLARTKMWGRSKSCKQVSFILPTSSNRENRQILSNNVTSTRITQRDHNNAVCISKILNFDNNDDIVTDPTGERADQENIDYMSLPDESTLSSIVSDSSCSKLSNSSPTTSNLSASSCLSAALMRKARSLTARKFPPPSEKEKIQRKMVENHQRLSKFPKILYN